jgi:hypothetical protein
LCFCGLEGAVHFFNGRSRKNNPWVGGPGCTETWLFVQILRMLLPLQDLSFPTLPQGLGQSRYFLKLRGVLFLMHIQSQAPPPQRRKKFRYFLHIYIQFMSLKG